MGPVLVERPVELEGALIDELQHGVGEDRLAERGRLEGGAGGPG